MPQIKAFVMVIPHECSVNLVQLVINSTVADHCIFNILYHWITNLRNENTFCHPLNNWIADDVINKEFSKTAIIWKSAIFWY